MSIGKIVNENGGSEYLEIILLLAEGNPGAATVLSHVAANKNIENPLEVFSKLQSNNIKGSSIWIGFKKADENPEQFATQVLEDNSDLVEYMLNN